MTKDLDDGRRPNWGVGVFAQKTDTGFRLIFDTLQRTESGSHPQWKTWAFMTHGNVDEQKFLSHQLSTEEYVALGETLLALLVALTGKGESRDGM